MRINFVEISNFRKLRAVRVELTKNTTLFVGANNSGKTSAMLALRRFLVDHRKISIRDFTLSCWPTINEIGTKWETAAQTNDGHLPIIAEWDSVLPSMDVWLHVADDEIHYVSRLLPTLNWQGGLLGVRLRFEPKSVEALYKEYIAAVSDVKTTKASASANSQNDDLEIKLWPQNMIDFLDRRLRNNFSVRGYILNPEKCVPPTNGVAAPQALVLNAEPIDGDPFEGLIRIDEINAQRGFGNTSNKPDNLGGDAIGDASPRESRKLSEQLRAYYANHLDPFDKPDVSDLAALQAINFAQAAFDKRLEECFKAALSEVETLGYPGVSDPKLKISTKIRPTDGLSHDSAVQYEVDTVDAGTSVPILRLPEDSNGLGYQNLISMVFRLMSFRDAWMRVGKAGKGINSITSEKNFLPPLHLVLVEEPEAHLHAQVQQVFIRKAYAILRAHTDLDKNERLTTQLIVSTHSSYVAHEPPFSCLRYFRRLPAGMAGNVPVSTVVNLSEVFGDTDDSQRFVTRYLRTTHCDLFFADAAILVEGPAERMLVPHFIRKYFGFLNQCYITVLEIGGSHAHRLEPLIKHLGLLTLVITDLDAANVANSTAAPPERGKEQITKNATLSSWAPKRTRIDDLLNATDEEKVLRYDPLSAVRVAYQCPLLVKMGAQDNLEALPSTFEDALVFENLTLFSALQGTGLVRNFKEAIETHGDPAALGRELFNSLRTGKKAEFALDLLELKDTDQLKVPTYINQGLTWLDTQLRKKQEEVLLAPNASTMVQEESV